MMTCLYCGTEYNGDPRSYYCGTICRKRAENARARLKKLMTAYPQVIQDMDEAAFLGDRLRANRLKLKAQRINEQIESLRPVFTEQQNWFAEFYKAMSAFA